MAKVKKLIAAISAAAVLSPISLTFAGLNSWMGSAPTIAGGNIQVLIGWIINILLGIAGVVAVIYLIIGGYQYVTASGNAEQAQAARTTILNAIIGLVIIFAAYLIINFVMNQLGFFTT